MVLSLEPNNGTRAQTRIMSTDQAISGYSRKIILTHSTHPTHLGNLLRVQTFSL